MADGWPEIAVHEAGPLDVPVIAFLHAECFADRIGGAAWSQAAIAKVLSLPGSYGYLAMSCAEPGPKHAGLAPAGFLLARAAAGESEILSLGVAASWRRRGAARASLDVAEENLAARGLYAVEGFAVVSRRPDYYRRLGGAPAAALVFARRLPR